MTMPETPDRPPDPTSPSSDGKQNRRTKDFRFLFDELPEEIQDLATKTFKLFLNNPHHPSLRRHTLKDNNKCQHVKDSISISVGMQYRAIFFEDGNTNVWYWIGTHARYNQFTGKN